jgi:hypothetical protein
MPHWREAVGFVSLLMDLSSEMIRAPVPVDSPVLLCNDRDRKGAIGSSIDNVSTAKSLGEKLHVPLRADYLSAQMFDQPAHLGR